MIEFRLPQFGMGMTDGTITRWCKQEGDAVTEGETLLEVEAAKTAVEVPSPITGILARIVVPVDNNVAVQTVLALIEPANAGAAQPNSASTPSAHIAPERSDTTAAASAALRKRDDAAPQIEPKARRLALDLGIDLAKVRGSGPNGRIIEADVRSVHSPAPSPVAAPTVQDSRGEAGYVDKPHSRVRRVIAERLSESKGTVPHFYLVTHCEIDRLIDIRAQLNASAAEARVSVNDFIVLALARALKSVPEANVGWTDAALRHYADVDIAVAVATDGGLITPIVRQANTKSLRAIADETKVLATRARAGQLAPHEYEGGTASVSNLGMFGTEAFTAIINPPQACILAVGAGTQRAIVRNGAMAIATVMTCTLSVDHRAIDGAVAAKLLSGFKALIEEPQTLLS